MVKQKDEAALCEYLHLPATLWQNSLSWAPGSLGGPPALRSAIEKLLSIVSTSTPEDKGRVLIETRQSVMEAIFASARESENSGLYFRHLSFAAFLK